MRISDWSSDVCSSDLTRQRPNRGTEAKRPEQDQRHIGKIGRCRRHCAAQRRQARLPGLRFLLKRVHPLVQLLKLRTLQIGLILQLPQLSELVPLANHLRKLASNLMACAPNRNRV